MNLTQYKQLLAQIGAMAGERAGKYTLLAAKDVEGRMKLRIFKKGLNAKNTKIGKYKSKSWIKQRKEGGKHSKGGR